MMKIIKIFLLFFLAINFSLADDFSNRLILKDMGNHTEIVGYINNNEVFFKGDLLENKLTVKINGNEQIYKDVVGVNGQIYKDLVIFNNSPALIYSNTASRYKFNVYYTLKSMNNELIVDCAYAEITEGFTNISMNKAICGLNQKFDSNYSDIIYSFSDKWISLLSSEMENSNRTVITETIGDVSIESYSFLDESLLNNYIYMIYNNKKIGLVKNKTYMVYFFDNPLEIIALDEENNAQLNFTRYFEKDIKQRFKDL